MTERWVTPTEALEILLAAHEPQDAGARLNAGLQGLQTKRLRLRCNGTEVNPNYVRRSLLVEVRAEGDTRWIARVVGREAWEHEPEFYRFEFETDEVKALLPPEAPEPEPKKNVKRARRRRRRKPKPPEAEKVKPPEAEKPKPPEAPPPAPKQPPASKSRPQEACRQFVARKYPHGYDLIGTTVIMHAAEHNKEFKQTVVPFPNRDVWLRALGRRKS
jgi:hypothetical protein